MPTGNTLNPRHSRMDFFAINFVVDMADIAEFAYFNATKLQLVVFAF